MIDELGTECAPIEACLPLLVGGELEQPLAEQVEAHVARCTRCSSSLSALKAALSHLAAERERVDPTVDLWPNLQRELVASGRIIADPLLRSSDSAGGEWGDTEPAKLRPAGAVASRNSSWLRRAALLAAAAGIAVLTWQLTNSETPTSPDGAPGARHGLAAVSDATPAEPRGAEFQASPGHIALVGDGPASAASTSSGSTPALDPAETLVAGPLSAPLGERAAGLRRLGSEEPLLRDSIDPRGSGGDYSLAGSRGLR